MRDRALGCGGRFVGGRNSQCFDAKKGLSSCANDCVGHTLSIGVQSRGPCRPQQSALGRQVVLQLVRGLGGSHSVSMLKHDVETR